MGDWLATISPFAPANPTSAAAVVPRPPALIETSDESPADPDAGGAAGGEREEVRVLDESV